MPLDGALSAHWCCAHILGMWWCGETATEPCDLQVCGEPSMIENQIATRYCWKVMVTPVMPNYPMQPQLERRLRTRACRDPSGFLSVYQQSTKRTKRKAVRWGEGEGGYLREGWPLPEIGTDEILRHQSGEIDLPKVQLRFSQMVVRACTCRTRVLSPMLPGTR